MQAYETAEWRAEMVQSRARALQRDIEGDVWASFSGPHHAAATDLPAAFTARELGERPDGVLARRAWDARVAEWHERFRAAGLFGGGDEADAAIDALLARVIATGQTVRPADVIVVLTTEPIAA